MVSAPSRRDGDGTPTTYILSVGVCVGVTALPVLSAILMEIGQLESALGRKQIGWRQHDTVVS